MLKKIGMLLVVAVLGLCAVAFAGCGDDEESSSGGGGSSTEESSGGSEDSGGGASNPQVQAAVDACKQSISAQAQLSAGVKSDLEDICEEAASGDEDAVRQASKDVCIKIVEETVPEGAARDQATDACEQATAAP